jgi:hypothetical protein
MSELWVPPGASTDDLVARVHEQVRRFSEREQCPQTLVEVQLRDGGTYKLDTLSPEPGHGFLTLRPHVEDGDDPEELIVPLAAVAQIRIAPAEPETRFGFALPDGG